MTYNRRLFLRNTALIASGIAMTGIGCASPSGENGDGTDSLNGSDTARERAAAQALAQFGLQLYSLRDDLPKDPKGILKQVSSFGYKQVEGYEHAKLGIWWGMKNTELKKYLDDIGLTMVASHCDTKKNFEKKAAEAGEIGMKYLISPWIGPQKTLDDYKKIADEFNKLGDICKKNGLRFAYHNHGYSFEQLDGQYPQDVLMQGSNPDTVDFEMDIYWVVVPDQDPVAWLRKYPNRFRLCHVKDRMKNAAPGEENASTEVGAGSIDFKRILSAARETGMEYYIVEQERYDNSTPLKGAEASANYLKTFTF